MINPTNIEHVEGETTVTFMSYNPTGLDSTAKCRFSNDIVDEYNVDFLSIQEHFKSTKNTDQYFKKKFPDHFSYVIAANRSPGQEYGRAKAGLAQLTKKNLEVKKSRIITQGYRVQAQILSLPSSNGPVVKHLYATRSPEHRSI